MPTNSETVSNKRFKAFEHQVAGHGGVLVDEEQLMIIKPAVPIEKEFYEKALAKPEFMQFAPKYYGTLIPHLENKDGSASATDSSSQAESANNGPGSSSSATAQQELPQEYICIQNLIHGFAKPCVMDIKVGTRLYDDFADEKKRRKMMEKARNTTAESLGFYICGIKVYEDNLDKPTVYEREWCIAHKADNITNGLGAYFPESLCPKFRSYIIRQFITELEEYRDMIKSQELKMYSASMLFVYDADVDRRNAFFSQPEKPTNTGDDEDEEAESALLDVRTIDFAHSFWTPGSKIDDGYLTGINNLIDLFGKLDN